MSGIIKVGFSGKISVFALLLLVLTALSSCSSVEQVQVPVRVYVMEESEEVIKPSLTLNDDGTCIFMYSGLSSYLPVGTYTYDGEVLTITTDDNGGKIYVFSVKDEKLYFKASKSTPIPDFANVYDGAEFK